MDGEKQLYEAARTGDITTFRQLLQTNTHLVDVVSFSLLHIAIKHGQESIVEEVLDINQELALDLDSKNSSSLHIAAARGNAEIAKRLLSIAPEMCWWRDCHDMNPIHVAAMKGNEDVLKEMIQLDFFPAMERLHRGKTVLHLCVQHRQLGTLKVLVEELGALVRAKDDDGETALHLAVRSDQLEMIMYLVKSDKIKGLTENSMGNTERDILDESSREKNIERIIVRMLNTLSSRSKFQEWVPHFNDTTIVVVVLIAAMAFQAAVSPPGGVWQETTSSHSAGKSVMASTHPKIYKHFVRATSTAFVSSLITLFIISTGVTTKHLYFLIVAQYTMMVSMGSIAMSYGLSLIMTYPVEILSLSFLAGLVLAVIFIFLVLLILLKVMKGVSRRLNKKKRHRMDLTTLDQAIMNNSTREYIMSEMSYSISQILNYG